MRSLPQREEEYDSLGAGAGGARGDLQEGVARVERRDDHRQFVFWLPRLNVDFDFAYNLQ